jgi:ABC-2 type transport system permease protein
MQKILAIIRKDILLRFASWTEWLFFFIMPVAFTVILSGGTGRPANFDSRIRLVVVDQAQSSLSAVLIHDLENSESIRPEMLGLDKAERELSQRKVSAVLIIPASFSEDNIIVMPQVLEMRQQPNDINALAIKQVVTSAINRITSAVDIAKSSVSEAERFASFSSENERQNYFNAALLSAQDYLGKGPDRITVVQGTTIDSIEYDPSINSSTGQMITWVFIPLIGISGLFAYERENGTLRRLLISPTQRATYLLGTLLGNVLAALVQMLLLISVGVLVFDLKWGQAPVALAVMMIASALAAAALGVMLGAFVKSSGQASGLSIMIGMLMALLGGCWYPLDLFPEFARTAVKILPTSWAMQGMLNIVLRGQGLEGVLLSAGVLLGFAAVFFTIGVWRFKVD